MILGTDAMKIWENCKLECKLEQSFGRKYGNQSFQKQGTGYSILIQWNNVEYYQSYIKNVYLYIYIFAKDR